jgi:hypothetical protein
MYYIYTDGTYYTTMTDLRGAHIVAFNAVRYFDHNTAWVVDGETGEILKEYIKG